MKTQHTPGPWVTRKSELSRPESRRVDIVTTTGDFSPSFVAGDALPDDARLIASAPELLDAVDSCLEIMIRAIGERLPINRGTECEETDWLTAIRKARSAMAKATGEK